MIKGGEERELENGCCSVACDTLSARGCLGARVASKDKKLSHLNAMLWLMFSLFTSFICPGWL